MKVLVTGGSTFANDALVGAALDQLDAQAHIDMVVHMGEPGCDTLASKWAAAKQRPQRIYDRAWSLVAGVLYGRRPGAVIAAEVGLQEAGLFVVLGFAGGGGTRTLLRRAHEAGLRVITVSGETAPVFAAFADDTEQENAE